MILGLALLAMLTPTAREQHGQFTGIGRATESCTLAMQKAGWAEWAAGYFTGLNEAHNAMVGRFVDDEGIKGEIKLRCSQHPSEIFLETIHSAWSKTRSEGR